MKPDPNEVIEELEKIYKDCLMLERRGDLTEFGAGMGATCIQALKKKKKYFKFVKD